MAFPKITHEGWWVKFSAAQEAGMNLPPDKKK